MNLRAGPLAVSILWRPIMVRPYVHFLKWRYGTRSSWRHGNAFLWHVQIIW